MDFRIGRVRLEVYVIPFYWNETEWSYKVFKERI